MDTKQVISALTALAQDTRLAIFRLLVQSRHEGLPATQIAERLEIQPSSLSFHLKELTYENMVVQKKAGRSLIYSTNYETMHDLLDFLTENCCRGNICSPVQVPECTTEGACS